jgi:hypothetical protein
MLWIIMLLITFAASGDLLLSVLCVGGLWLLTGAPVRENGEVDSDGDFGE